ncbi:MAG: hypothetical protein LDL30_00185 [Desulfovibrio sp.]|nr:hypothetical protein [Desulfovibrio sp.]MCA1986333.1 hypothetical protein [Desulfovibrio sp.]
MPPPEKNSLLAALLRRRAERAGHPVDKAALEEVVRKMRLRIGSPSTPFGPSGLLVKDPMLAFRGDPDHPLHDALGYKNLGMPESVDVLVLGNSQVHSLYAPPQETWPTLLGARTGLAVYNGAMGSYSPIQYFLGYRELDALHAGCVVVVLYMGNNVYNSANTFRKIPDAFRKGFVASGLEAAANFPTHHATQIESSDPAKRIEQFMQAAKTDTEGFCFARVRQFTHYLLPALRLAVQNLQNEFVAGGLELALQSLTKLAGLARERGAPLVVLRMPTKERVVYERHREFGDVKLSAEAALQRLWAMEVEADRRIAEHLAALAVPSHCLGAPLAALLHEPMYPPLDVDGHPSLHGRFRVAEMVADFLAGTPALAPGSNRAL